MSSNVTEIVDLPDPAVQPLVHPLDLPEARAHFRRFWLIDSATGPGVAACLAALVWFASQSYVVPLIAGFAVLVLGRLAAEYSAREAWAFIPRKRQDRARLLPWTWRLGSGLAVGVMLAAALVLTALRLDRPDITEQVRLVTFGIGLAFAALTVGDQILRLIRRRPEALGMLPGTVAVLGAVFAAYTILFD
jgi:hypothetical protein